MAWQVECTRKRCGQQSWAANIVDLIADHTDEKGWFRCPAGHPAYIEKSFELQEPGNRWEPYLRGVVPLGTPGDTYQPFVFIVSYEPASKPTDVWFSYYKDLRESGGRLKLGYGPGGPPVLGTRQVVSLLEHLRSLGCVSASQLRSLGAK